MSVFDHYIPDSEQKARYGCFNFIAIAFVLLLVVWLSYGFYETVDRYGLNVVSLLGVIVFIAGVILFIREKWTTRGGIKTIGRVIDLGSDNENDSALSDAKAPIVRFLDKKGAIVNKSLSQSLTQGKLKMGDELKILVINDEVRLDKSNTSRDRLIILAGVALIVAGFIIL